MLRSLETLSRAMWGNKLVLATSAHFVGGIGLGLLLYPRLAPENRGPLAGLLQPGESERARTIADVLIGLSALAHLYAFVTQTEARPVAPAAETMAV